MWKVQRASEILREDGFISLIKKFYTSKIRPLLPTTSEYGILNGIEVKGSHPVKDIELKQRILEDIFPLDSPSKIPNFKQPNIEQIYNNYEEGDEIVIIGGGNGVTAVHSARIVGSEGEVKIFEADEERVCDLKETLRHNNVFDICEIEHSIVGQAHFVRSPGSANIIEPSDLPRCDALEMDCEGAELDILKGVEHLPNKMIVELHHNKSTSPYTSPDTIKNILEEMGYSVQEYNGPWVDGLCVAVLE